MEKSAERAMVIELRDNFSSFLPTGEGTIQESTEKVRDLYMHIKPVLCFTRLLSLTVPQVLPLRREKN